MTIDGSRWNPKTKKWERIPVEPEPIDDRIPEPEKERRKRKWGVRKTGTSGVYAIEVPSHNVVYVGQSVNIASRWGQHKHVLKRGTCEIEAMQKLWSDGAEFKFVILEETSELMREKEKEYAEQYVKRGYDLFNSYFILNPTNILTDDLYKPVFLKIMKLHTKGRLDLNQLETHLDTL